MIFTNKDKIPLSLALWLAHDEYDHSNDPKTISATTLLQPVRAIVLAKQQKSLEKVEDISNRVASKMGTSIHDSIEKAWKWGNPNKLIKELGFPEDIADKVVVNPNKETAFPDMIPVIMEQRYSKKIDGWTISGKMDFIGDGILEDFKTTGTYNYIAGTNDEKYTMQGSIYRWIVPELITKDYMYIRYIFTDWSTIKARQDKDYPKSKLATKQYPLVSLEETENFIKKVISNLELYMDKPQSSLPKCTPEELWQKPDLWKYYRDPTITKRSTKNFKTMREAKERFDYDGGIGVIKHVPGEVVRCRYCSASGLCLQADNYVKQGLLNL